jgi:hypothetical protein
VRGAAEHDADAPDARAARAAGGASGREPFWACAQLDDAPLLHLTLVPPASS